MKIKSKFKKTLLISLNGRLDTQTSHELEAALKDVINETDEIRFDFSELEYISSAGLRILLAAFKKVEEKNGNMYIENANEIVTEILEITGFASIFMA